MNMILFLDYFFVSREAMEKAIADEEFIEHAEFGGNLYGTRSEFNCLIYINSLIQINHLRKTVNLNHKNVIDL